MARLIVHEHPTQGGACLAGAFQAYVDRIPLEGYTDLDAVWQAARARPFDPDSGDEGCEVWSDDTRCRPAQRSRIWPTSMNCWETSAHFVRGALYFLPDAWTVHVWDRTLPNGARHVWPSLVSPRGDHLLVDLQTVSPRAYPSDPYTGVALPGRPANGIGNDILGGVHLVGKTALKVFGLGGLGDVIEEAEGDALPEWAREQGTPQPRATPTVPTRKPPARETLPRDPKPTRVRATRPRQNETVKRPTTAPPWRDPLDALMERENRS